MPSAALPEAQIRRSARRTGVRRPAREGAPPLTRNALVAEFLAICELDPEVEALRAPAPAAAFDLGGGAVEHTADFEVVRDGSSYLIDIATDQDLAQHPLRTATLRELVAVDGRPFAIETAASIRAEPRFTTMRLVQACRRIPVSAGDRVRILHQLDECGAMRLVDCAGAAMNAPDGVAAVLALACEGLIAVDIARPILPETQVRRRRSPYADPFAF
jgi:hypothetical protein